MRIFLDDERITPEGWVRTYWPDEVIALGQGEVTHVSLDHDLGSISRERATTSFYGSKRRLLSGGFSAPAFFAHSANSPTHEKC